METKQKSKFKWWYIPVGIVALGVVGNMMGAPDNEPNKPSNVTETSSQPVEEPKKESNWNVFSDTDKMSGKEEYYAIISAKELLEFEFPYNGGSEAKLQIRKTPTGTDLMLSVSKGQFNLGIDGGSAKIKFDDETAFTVSLTGPSDHSSDVVFLGSVKKCIEKLKKSKKALIEVEFFNEGNRVIEFETSGLEWNH